MNLDEMLRASALEVARDAIPPTPDLATVRRRARRTRGLQVLAAATAAVVVVGTAIGVLQVRGSDSGSPQPAEPTPTDVELRGAAAAVWSQGRTLHIGDDVVDVERELDQTVFGITLVDDGVVFSTDSHDGHVYYQPYDGSPPRRLGSNAQLTPVGDPASGTVAWYEAVDGQGSLVVYDIDEGREVARTSVEVALRPQDNIIFPGISPLLSVSESTVYYEERDQVWIYRFGTGDPAEPTGKTPTELLDVAGNVTARVSEDGTLEFGRPGGVVSSDVALGEPGGVERGQLSPSGTLFAGVRGGLSSALVVLVDARSGEEVPSDLESAFPLKGLLWQLGWIDDDTFVAKYLDSEAKGVSMTATLVTCAVSTASCVATEVEGQGFLTTVPLN